ncbi:hypothetical protein ABBQ32_009419 [Trebouxia sp. C0010 RCD-2024]
MVRERCIEATGQLLDVSQKRKLKVVDILEGFMFQVDGVLTEAEASRFVQTAESIGLKHQGSKGSAYGEAFRDNERAAFQDEAFAEHLWQRSGLADVFCSIDLGSNQTAVGLNPNIRLYRYRPGQRFGKHVDDSVNLGGGIRTEYTLLIYLTGSGGPAVSKPKGKSAVQGKDSSVLVGGETVFYGPRGKVVASIVPKAGRALLHRHGDYCLEHEASPVTSGLKYILRTDVCFATG